MILTGSWDGTARLWDAASGLPLEPPIRNPDSVRSAAFSPDGRTILTGCQDPTARLWDAATGTQVGRPLEHRGTVFSAVFSANGRSLLTGSRDGLARLWDGEVGQPLGRVLDYGSLMWPVAFSRDGKTILTIAEWELRQMRHSATCVAFSRDGKTILTGNYDGQVRLWDVASGHSVGPTVELGSTINAIALSPDGTTILTASLDHKARLWDAATGQPIGQPMEHPNRLRSVAFSRDGKIILTGCEGSGMARLWDAATGQPIGQPMKHPGRGYCVAAFSPDGKIILTSGWSRTARLWDAATGRPLGEPMPHEERVPLVMFSPDGRTILTGSDDKTVRLWDAATGRRLGPPLEHSASVIAAAFSPDGRTILIGCSDKTVRLWDADTGRRLGPPLELWDDVISVAFSPDGRALLAGGSRTARIWDAPAPLPDDVPRLTAWVEAATGLELDERGSIQVLDAAAWWERRRLLEQLGGPPLADPAPRLDPIVFGADPAARGDGWMERGLWDRAEAAYAEAIRARPLNRSAWDALARAHAARDRLDRTAATLAEAIRMMPDDPVLRRKLGVALLASGDPAGWRSANAALLDLFGGTINPWTANQVARSCVLGSGAATDPGMSLRLAEAAVTGAAAVTDVEEYKADPLIAFGAALYRAGRCHEAISRLEEAIRTGLEVVVPHAWPFLAMAHHRLGHRDEARRWLDKLKNHRPSADPDQFWNELETRVLRSEAEAVILCDPAFPDDPFAH
jgi:WD40 repeat protein/Flp pilus assembly protein TadD